MLYCSLSVISAMAGVECQYTGPGALDTWGHKIFMNIMQLISTQRINTGPTYDRGALQPHHTASLQLVTVHSLELSGDTDLLIMIMIMMIVAPP